MKQIFRTATFLFIVTAFIAPRAFAQQPLPHFVLFETFTNSCDPSGSAATSLRNTFDNNVTSTVSSEKSKIIHLDHHYGNECDFLQNAYSSQAAGYVFSASEIFYGAVDRAEFTSTGTRGSPNPSDWTGAIDAAYPPASPDNITLLNATLDKTNPHQYVLHADVQVSLTSSVSDSLVIRYAVVQDQVHDTLNDNGSSVTLNDVVRYITNSNSGYTVFPGGGSSGSQNDVSFEVSVLPGPTDKDYQIPFVWANMRLIAFIEDVKNGNFSVVDAVELKADLDTLQPPLPTLVISESSISGDTLTPGLAADIYYSSTNLQSGVNAFYSLNNGNTWNLIGNNQTNPVSWTVPDSVTTEGKIKLVAVGDTSLTSTEIGTFTIAIPPSVTFIEPQPEKIIKGDSAFTIYWTKVSVDSALLRYSLDNGVTFKALQNNADTFYVWSVPDTNRGVIIQLVPDHNAAPTAAVIDTIESTVTIPPLGVAENNASATGLTITNIFPNPASNGEDMVVQYFEAQPKPITVQLLDLLGRIMPENYATDNLAIHLNTSLLTAGTYVVRVSDGTNTVSKRVEIIR